MDPTQLSFFDSQNQKVAFNNVMHSGTFSATFADRTYMGVRFNKDRAYLLKRMLKAKLTWTKEKDIILSFDSIRRAGKPMSKMFLQERNWYVVDMDGRIYIVPDHGIEEFNQLTPLNFDWHLYDLFPHKLEMNKFYNDDRYEVDHDS